jgi:hypothetical protein
MYRRIGRHLIKIMVNDMSPWSIVPPMASRELQTSEVTRLRVREFNRLHIGGGVRLLKCEVCGGLTDHGTIVDRDLVEECVSGRLEKTGYERWILCPACAGKVIDKIKVSISGILSDIEKLRDPQ